MSERGPEQEPRERPAETSFHVRRSLEGEASSLGWVVEHFTPFLRAQARYRLGRHLRSLYDPEDLVQEVWAICLPKLGQIEARGGRVTPVLLRFLGTTLLRTYHHLLEKHLAGKPRVLSTSASTEEGSEGPVPELPDDVTGIVTGIVRRESRGRLSEAIEGLSEPQREIFILRALEELPYRLAAEKLGADEQNLRARFSRALETLRRSFPPSMIDELAE